MKIVEGDNTVKLIEEKEGIMASRELRELMWFILNQLSNELPTLTIDVNYFMVGCLLQKQSDLYMRLESCLVSTAIQTMQDTWLRVVSSKTISAIKPNRTPKLDEKMEQILAEAKRQAEAMGAKEYTSEHVMLAILADDDENNKIRKVFNKAGITYGILLSKMKDGAPSDPKFIQKTIQLPNGALTTVNMFRAKNEEEAKQIIEKMGNMQIGMDPGMGDDMGAMVPGVSQKKKGSGAYIKQYCNDLVKMALDGKIDPLIGREKEVDEIIRILGRKNKNNAILVGGEGVGKTAIGESIAYKIAFGQVPEFLSGRILVSLDMTALMAGTTLRGMFEERVKGIIDDVVADRRYILFIDNIGAVFADKGKNDFELSSMLSRSLEKGVVQVIGTSDFASYRKTFDKDPSLARRFQKIIVEAPTKKESVEILMGLKDSYEKFHKVKYSDEAINECVNLAERYISERNLPDSAIDIMDEIGVVKGLYFNNEELAKTKARGVELMRLRDEEKDDEKREEYNKEIETVNGRVKEIIAEYEKNPTVITKEDIMDIVSKKTGIPTSNLSSDDKKKLFAMNDRIKEGVIGQDDAIDTICKALKRNRIGLRKNGCLYSAIEIGRTGVGKTLIAKKLAKELFGDEKALVRFDMSEFSDKVSVNKLIGSNPGYVGYEEGGQLTEAIKNKKHCVLLLDEIEKADPEVYNIFLQVLDEGFLTDNSGMRVDFSNVIVLFTSNVGAKNANEFSRGIGFKEDQDENAKKILTKQLKNRFPPEFLNRIDDIIYFNSLSDDDLKSIIRIEMGKLNTNLKSLGHDMEYGDDVVDFIFDNVKNEKEFGARPIMRAIQDEVEDKITDFILENDINEGYIFKISCCQDKSEVVVA